MQLGDSMAKKKDFQRSIDSVTKAGPKRSKKLLGLDLGTIGKTVATAVIAEIANTAISKATQPDREEAPSGAGASAPDFWASSPSQTPGTTNGSATPPQKSAAPDRAESQSSVARAGEQSADRTEEPPTDQAEEQAIRTRAEEPDEVEDDETEATREPARQISSAQPLRNGDKPALAETLGQTLAQSVVALGQRALSQPQAIGAAAADRTEAMVSQTGELSEQAIETISAAVQRALEQALAGLGTVQQTVAQAVSADDAPAKSGKGKKRKKKRKKK